MVPYLPHLAVANLVVNVLIVVTGGAVRLTASGLGCPTWPRCTDESYVPHGELGLHGAIEFGNRMITFLVTAVALLCILAAWRAGNRRVTWLALGVASIVPAQVVIGGITVLTDLNPWVVAFHLLVSMLIIQLCVWLLVEVADWAPSYVAGSAAPPIHRRVQKLAGLVYGAGWLVLYLGTVVTGSGPHAGDHGAARTGLDPQLFSHVHAFAVYLLVALTFGLVFLARRGGATSVETAALVLLAVEIGQGVVGFTQYALDLPVGLVALHMLGAALTSAALAWVLLAARRTPV
ncbi:heme A synthase [Nocardioides guangzhouensis]|uniref:Heme A synthase n=1 Tax=Nocardioides guangzhouensis TaxID=2497878 RepID=A0A4Q4ZJC6_9ACTN|nr:heme A synthase [Nocardioides guangzhouensis]